MNTKRGFTLMELLLVVAVLAIVAAAAAPTFFGGAKDALREARKANVSSAFSNLMSEATMSASLQMAKNGEVADAPKDANGKDTNWPAKVTVNYENTSFEMEAKWDKTRVKIIASDTPYYNLTDLMEELFPQDTDSSDS